MDGARAGSLLRAADHTESLRRPAAPSLPGAEPTRSTQRRKGGQRAQRVRVRASRREPALPPVAEEAQQQQEKVDEVQIEPQRPYQSPALARVALQRQRPRILLDLLRVV